MKSNEGEMKKLYKVIIVLFFLFANTNIFAQAASITWQLVSDQNPNTPIGNIQALSQSIGTPTSPYKLEMYPQQPYASNGQQLWTGNQGTGWIAGLPDYTRYIQFDASPSSGNSFTVQFISFQYSDYPTPNNSDFHILKSEVWYSTDNWNSQVQLNSNSLDYLSSAIQTFSANVNVLVQNGQTFSLRIYPYAPNGAIAMTPSFATHRNVIIEGTTEASNTVESVCIDFENELASGWQTSNAELTIQQDGENHYLQTTDQSGASTLFYNSGSLIGDWNSYLENGCGSLCWDVNYLYAGVGNDGSSQPITITPTIRIEGNGFAAYFLTNNLITAGDGWHSYCAPLSFINSGDPLPSNSDGQWIMITGTSSDWNSMLTNITLLRFSIDPTSYQSERFGFDNICIKNTGDCNPPVQLGSICGMKFDDLNGNGDKDDGELGLSGWIITLTMGAVQLTDTTDADGNYCFNDLAEGTYTLSEINQDGWQQTFPAENGNHTVTVTSGLNLIGIDFGNRETLESSCTDFEDGTSGGWQVNNTQMSIQQADNNHFIQTTDQSGASYFFNNSRPFTGNWSSLFANGCGSLCFDVSFLYGGNPYNGVNPPQTFTPYIAIEGNGFSARFITNNPITVGDGWHSYCAPLNYLNSDGTLPSNSDGHWIITTGSANDWNSLLSNVTKVILPVDPTSYQAERFGYDNICLKNSGDCNSPLQLGSICGFKIHDKDGDGVKDSNEDGIPNWTITLIIGTTIYTAATDANGEYCFNDLPAGTYIVEEENREGWQQVFPLAPGYHTVILPAGQNITDINFSNVEDSTIELGSICGIKFNDINGDGDQDLPDELGLPNWQFNLTGTATLTTTTDLNGNFCFTNLRAGSYTIQEVVKDGWQPTAPDTTGTVNLTLLRGQNLEGIFFGNKEILGSICGMKYNDLNEDGNWDNEEPGLPNWEITLSSMGYTASGHFSGPTLNLISTVTTGKNGTYCFTNVKPGNYIVGEIAQNGWTETEPSSFIYGITITPGQEITGLNFGNKEDVTIRLGSICGIKFNDKNDNGRQDDGELGIPDWQIQIEGPVDMTVVTDKNGNFCFENLPPGEYKVGEEFRSGWRKTKPSTNFYIILLASGQNLLTVDFGNTIDDKVQLGSICGTKFNDKNRDGRKVSGESGIANWTIHLEGPMNLTVVTDDNGNFCFYGLIPGTYTVREENKTGWRQTKPSSITYTLEVGNGDNFTGIDFGNFEDPTVTLGSICGMKFNDLNGDGRKQDNEPAIPNWTINLSGTIDLSTTTDSRGNFCFENLRFGRYTVSEANRDGWIPTAPSTGSYTVELSEDQNPDNLYFGNKVDTTVTLGSICGMKFLDKNGNGRKDFGEYGIANWQINLGGPVDRSVKTDKEGKYCFDDLTPGTYIIKEESQTDWVQTYPASVSYTVALTSGQNLMGYDFGNKYEPKTGCVEPPSGMVAWWSFDYSSKDSPQDFAGYNNFGTKMNAPTAVAGKVLGALQFDGVDDYVEVADHSELNFGTGDFSFDAWIKTTASSGISPIVDKRDPVTGKGYSFFLHNGNLGLQLADASLETNYIPAVLAADGNWHHIAITVSRTNKNGIIFYLDGVPTPYGDPTLHSGSLNNTNPLRIGREFGFFASQFKGILDEIELFNRVLTQAEIVSIYNAGSAGKCKPTGELNSVSGHVFYDVDGDGFEGPGDRPLSNWNVFINGPTIETNFTDENGNYTFTNLNPGTYTLSVAIQSDWSGTSPLNGNYTLDIAPGISIDKLNFGFTNNPCDTGIKTWSPLGSGLGGGVTCLATDGLNLYAGGYFITAGNNQTVNHIAKWNGFSWSPLIGTNGAVGVNGNVYAIAVNGNKVYVGGQFTSAGGVTANSIAVWDGVSWSSLTSTNGVNGVSSSVNPQVLSLAILGNELYVGGLFTSAGGITANNIARWNGSNWSAVGNGFDNAVSSLTVIGTDIYAGGFFEQSGNVLVNKIAKWNGTNWLSLNNGVDDNVWTLINLAWVHALATDGNQIYAGGMFDIAGGLWASNIAKWNGSSWSASGMGSGGVNSSVRALAVMEGNLYAGGDFTTTNPGNPSVSVSANRIAKWDGSNWSALGSGMFGNSGCSVAALAEIGGDLYAAGTFYSAGGVYANNIAKYSCSSTPTSVYDDQSNYSLPQNFNLSQNFPNPFNPTTTIRYNIPKAGFVKISVYDILGQQIKVLVNEEKNPGVYEVKFDGKNLASGIYFYTIRTADFYKSKKMILLK
ncbi:MAG: T9SS type A sorting domain-containing protein [Ignavibacteriales bacterium]|nr:T9SS type A sorting domain-containing protein [Ignavibacteriales bacterium]